MYHKTDYPFRFPSAGSQRKVDSAKPSWIQAETEQGDECVDTIDDRDESRNTDESRSEQILQFIKSHPGAHFRQVKRELNLAVGVVQYHLYRLEKDGSIASRRRGLYKRFYPNLKFGDSQLDILDALSQETDRELLLFLMRNPEAIQKEVSEHVGISPASVSWHMRRLSRAGLVEARRQGTNVRYLVSGNHSEILALLRGYHPTIWERWSDRLAESLMEIPQTRSETSEGE